MTDRAKRQLREGSAFAIKLIIGLIFISPLILGFLFTFQSDEQMMAIPLKVFTDSPTLENYLSVFQRIPLFTYLKNSFIVCAVSIVGQLIIACLTAYAFASFDFPGKQFLFTLILLAMMIPGQVVVITNYVTVQNIGLMDTYVALIATSLVGGTSIFNMRQYFLTLPKDFKESAKLDGCGEMGFLFRVAMPLSIPTLASLAIYLFINIYNAYFWPLLVTNHEEMRTVQIGISFLVTGDAINYGRVLAGAIVTIIPSVIIYILGQDYIIKGMTAGGLKG